MFCFLRTSGYDIAEGCFFRHIALLNVKITFCQNKSFFLPWFMVKYIFCKLCFYSLFRLFFKRIFNEKNSLIFKHNTGAFGIFYT